MGLKHTTASVFVPGTPELHKRACLFTLSISRPTCDTSFCLAGFEVFWLQDSSEFIAFYFGLHITFHFTYSDEDSLHGVVKGWLNNLIIKWESIEFETLNCVDSLNDLLRPF
jgi:hypothetical protein